MIDNSKPLIDNFIPLTDQIWGYGLTDENPFDCDLCAANPGGIQRIINGVDSLLNVQTFEEAFVTIATTRIDAIPKNLIENFPAPEDCRVHTIRLNKVKEDQGKALTVSWENNLKTLHFFGNEEGLTEFKDYLIGIQNEGIKLPSDKGLEDLTEAMNTIYKQDGRHIILTKEQMKADIEKSYQNYPFIPKHWFFEPDLPFEPSYGHLTRQDYNKNGLQRIKDITIWGHRYIETPLQRQERIKNERKHSN